MMLLPLALCTDFAAKAACIILIGFGIKLTFN
ncbi:MAG: hypothetical protein H6R01_1136 [Burkholderiaceae bacterium]|nr:hypothetical protein [Burkholderiaceae bacterium]